LRRILLRLVLAAVAFVVAGVGFVIALAYATVGIYFVLADVLGPAWGAFATAVLAILISVILIAVGYSYTYILKRRGRKGSSTDPSFLAAMLGDLLGRRFNSLANSNARNSIFMSLAAGFAIGASPKLREYLLDIMRL
jgi:hypothetical protein